MPNANILSDEEFRAVKNAVFLDMVLRVFDRDMERIKTTLKTPRPYINAIEQARKRAYNDLVAARQIMRKRGIKIYEQTHEEKHLAVRYKCRGYHHEDTYLWDRMKVVMESTMKYYLGEEIDLSQI